VAIATITPPVTWFHLIVSSKVPVTSPLILARHFDGDTTSSNILAIHFCDGVIGVAGIIELHKSKARWLVCHPHLPYFTKLAEGVAEIFLLDSARSTSTNVNSLHVELLCEGRNPGRSR